MITFTSFPYQILSLNFSRNAHDNFVGIKVTQGPDVTVKDSVASYNERNGILVLGDDSSNPTNVQFEGTVSSHHNKIHGIDTTIRSTTSNKYISMNVKGVVNTFLNGLDGIFIRRNILAEFTVEDGGSFNSCQNDGFDIGINSQGTVSFVDDGSDGDGYTCDGNGRGGTGFPSCLACPICP